jgi:hypothetical protein
MPNPQEPQMVLPTEDWEYFELWHYMYQGVLFNISDNFQSSIRIEGIRATEIYTFGAVLGAVIESEVVRTLNDLRPYWDPSGHYIDYVFERQPQCFPDVLLLNKKATNKRLISFGIELKSWYLLAKEGEPSFRFTVSPHACTSADLIVVVPWSLSFVVSGTPVVFEPFVLPARYVAEYRNFWWKYKRIVEEGIDTGIDSLPAAQPYPLGREEIADKPHADKGRNFGRIARIGIMDEYILKYNEIELLGIKVAQWREFFKRGIEAR